MLMSVQEFFHGRMRVVAAFCLGALLAGCGGGSGDKASAPAESPVSTTPAAGDTPATGAAPATGDSSTAPEAAAYTALSWPEQQPDTQYTLADGTLVTRIGGRTRDRHAREQPETAGEGDNYQTFAAHYFERRSHAISIYENVSPTNAENRILTAVVRPQWWYGSNFRHSYIGRRDGDPAGPSAVALYGDNGGMKRLPPGALTSNMEL